ncbi:MAG: hypothetical protein N3D74_03115 [Caldisericia bacterium]|nr:hypothetical protein [Caldisericia bacterium]
MINKEEIKKVLETIDAFKLISLKAEKEKSEFTRYMAIWGLILTITFAYYGFGFKFLGDLFWLYIFLFGAFLSTLKVSNYLISGVSWALTGLITSIVYNTFKNYILMQMTFVVLIFISYSINYYYQERFKKEDYIPIKLSVSSKIGITWGIIFSGMGFTLISLIKYLLKLNTNYDYRFIFTLLFGFTTGVGIFISGLIDTLFFIFGLFGIFGVPICSIINKNLGILVASLVPLLTSIYSGFIYFKRSKK